MAFLFNMKDSTVVCKGMNRIDFSHPFLISYTGNGYNCRIKLGKITVA